MVARTVTKYARAGVAGLHIEDQVQTKRCGHLMGKQVVSREEFLQRIRAAVIARDSIPGGSDFVIIGRTDSAQVLGMEEAVTRLKLAADAGADVCFIEGVKTSELLTQTVQALAPKPVLVNVISGGLTPSFTCQEAEALGAKIISESQHAFLTLTRVADECMNSLLPGVLCCDGARCPGGHAPPQEDRHGLLVCAGNGPQGVLQGGRPGRGDRARRQGRRTGLCSGLICLGCFARVLGSLLGCLPAGRLGRIHLSHHIYHLYRLIMHIDYPL